MSEEGDVEHTEIRIHTGALEDDHRVRIPRKELILQRIIWQSSDYHAHVVLGNFLNKTRVSMIEKFFISSHLDSLTIDKFVCTHH